MNSELHSTVDVSSSISAEFVADATLALAEGFSNLRHVFMVVVHL
jgi:hypothetical protein